MCRQGGSVPWNKMGGKNLLLFFCKSLDTFTAQLLVAPHLKYAMPKKTLIFTRLRTLKPEAWSPPLRLRCQSPRRDVLCPRMHFFAALGAECALSLGCDRRRKESP